MSITTGLLFTVAATVLMTFSGLCLLMAPWSFDSRDALVLAIGTAGLAFAVMAARHFREIHRQVPCAARRAG